MPKSVCKTCVCKLDEFHRFREACVQAEIALESNLKDQQSSAFPLEPEVYQIIVFYKLYMSKPQASVCYCIRFGMFKQQQLIRGAWFNEILLQELPIFLNICVCFMLESSVL